MKKKLIVLSGSVLAFMPFLASAQNAPLNACDGGTVLAWTIQDIICKIGNILDTAIPILVVLGVVYFVWGVIIYVISDDEEAKQKGKMRMTSLKYVQQI